MPDQQLRAVQPGETAPKKQTVAQAAESGDHRAMLVATRARLAKAIDDPKTLPRDLAALTRRLMDTAAELKALDAESEEAGGGVSTADEDWNAEAL